MDYIYDYLIALLHSSGAPSFRALFADLISYSSDLVYKENNVRMAHVLNSVAVHYKSAKQIVILTTSVLAFS